MECFGKDPHYRRIFPGTGEEWEFDAFADQFDHLFWCDYDRKDRTGPRSHNDGKGAGKTNDMFDDKRCYGFPLPLPP